MKKGWKLGIGRHRTVAFRTLHPLILFILHHTFSI